MAGKVKRSQVKHFLNTGTTLSPTYSLISKGVTSGTINYNPQTEEEQYIGEDTGTTEITAYRPTMPVEAKAVAGDAVFDYVDGLRKDRAVLADSHTDMVNVWLYEAAVGGAYPAEKQDVSIQVDDFGGDAGQTTVLNFTINYLGDAVKGMFNPSTLAFTPDA